MDKPLFVCFTFDGIELADSLTDGHRLKNGWAVIVSLPHKSSFEDKKWFFRRLAAAEGILRDV
jgi:hypothetical protein